MRTTFHSILFCSSVGKGLCCVFMAVLFSPSMALSQVQQSALSASLKGTEAVSIVTIGNKSTLPGRSDYLPVSTLGYPDGRLVYRAEYGLSRGEVTQMEMSFDIGTTFKISSVDLKDDRLELKLNGPIYSGSGRLKLMLGPGWQTRMSNEGVMSVIGKFLTLPSAATSGGTANPPNPSTAIAPSPVADSSQPYPDGAVEADVLRRDGLELLVKTYLQHKNACEHAATGTDQKQNFQMMKNDAIPIRASAQRLLQMNSESPTALALLIDLDFSLAMFRRPEDAAMLKESELLQPRLLQSIRAALKPEGNVGDQWDAANSSIRVVCLRAIGYAAYFAGDYPIAQQSLKEVVAAQSDGMDRGSISLLASAYLSAKPPVVDGLFWAAKFAIVSGNSLDYAKDQYIKYHGGDAGFDELVAAARTNPTIPARYAAAPPLAPLKLPATYVSAQTPTDKLQLNTDRSFSLQEGGQPYHGTFIVSSNTIELNISETSTKTTLGRQGDNLTDSSGQTWSHREQSAGTVPSGAVLRNGDIIKLAKVGVDDATISAKIRSSRCQFDTSTDALVLLKKSGVSAAVLKAMVGAAQ